jgi:hypothetical protein
VSALAPGGGSPKKRGIKNLSPRAKALASGAVTVVVLAGVIFGLWSATTPKRQPVPQPTVQASLSEQSDLAYQQGLASLESSDTTAAAASLQRAVRLNPDNTDAKKKLAEIAAQQAAARQKSNIPPSEPKPKPSVVTVDPFSKPVKHLTVLLPKQVAGYSLGPSQVLGADATRSGNSTDAASPVARALWAVHDLSSASKAKTFVSKVSKSLYPKDPGTVTIDGISAYFGTDGTRFATVSYVRGRFAFEVVLTSSSGSPSALKSDATKMAEAFPTKP